MAEDLRTALRTLAGPAVPPPGARDRILSAVDRRRRRHWAASGLGAVAATVAVVGGIALAGALGDDDPPTAGDPDPRPTTTAPYDATACPPQLPDRPERAERLPDLTQVVSIRLCTDDRDYAQGAVPARPGELAASPDPEALVFGLDRFAADVASLASADLGWCAGAFVASDPAVLQLAMADGSTELVSTSLCREVWYGDRRLDAFAIRQAFLTALDAQRSAYSYRRTVDAPLTCQVLGEPGPVQPGRERLVDAAHCGPFDEAFGGSHLTPLTDAELATLRKAWAEAYRHDHTDEEAESGACTGPDDENESIVARTDRGDVVTLRGTPCGYLVMGGWALSSSWAVPLTLDDL